MSSLLRSDCSPSVVLTKTTNALSDQMTSLCNNSAYVIKKYYRLHGHQGMGRGGGDCVNTRLQMGAGVGELG